MATKLGTVLGTVLGTDLGAFSESPPAPSLDMSKIYGLGSLSATNFFETPANGGEQGIAGGGFTIVHMHELDAVGNQRISNASWNGAAGWTLDVTAFVLRAYASTTAGGNANADMLPPSVLGKLDVAIVSITGTNLVIEALRGQLKVSVALAGYKVGTGTHQISANSNNGFASGKFVAQASCVGVLSDAQKQAVWDGARVLGTLPPLPGERHRYDVRGALAIPNAPVADGAAAPATIPDLVTNATADRMAKAGSPVIRVIDPSTPKIWGYETNPLFRGADALTNTDRFDSTFDDIAVNSGWWYTALMYMPSLTQGAAVIAGASSASSTNTGWDLRVNANNAILNWYMGDGSTFAVGGNAVAAVGKINVFTAVWDAPNLRQRTYINRAEVGTGVARTAYAPPPAGTKTSLGRSLRDPGSAGGVRTLIGWAQGLGVPTLAQIQAQADAILSAEAMQPIPGLTTVLVDTTQDIVGNGGTLPSALANRGSLGGSFTKSGAPTTVPLYARLFGW